MTRASLACTSVLALGLALPAAPALALTADAAWARWQEAATQAGATISVGGQQSAGGALTLTDVAIASDLGEEDVTFTATLDTLVFAEQGSDVAVTVPASIPMTLAGADSDGESVNFAMSFTQSGLAMLMSDAEEGGVTTTYSADTVGIVLGALEENGEPIDITGGMTVTTLSGTYSETGGDVPVITSDTIAEMTEFSLAGTDPEEGGTFNFAVSIADIVSSSTGTMSTLTAASADLAELLAAGLTTAGTGSAGAITFDLTAQGMPESFAMNGSMSGAEGEVILDAAQLLYDVAYRGIEFTASGSEIPFPQVTGGLGESHTRLMIPAAPTEEAQPMAFTVALRDLVMGEEIWSLFDGGGTLPRDPATLVIDLGGSMKVLQSLFSEEAMASAELPAEVETLDIRQLLLTVVGAELTGTGAFAFDWSAPGPFGPGTPIPDGSLNLKLTGGQALLDRLVQMGLLRQEDAMMARMMTGMVAVPGPGPDELVSEITVQPDGQILANGAPLPF